MLADPPGTFNVPLPVELLIWPIAIGVFPLVLIYMVFVVREAVRGRKTRAAPREGSADAGQQK